MPTEGPHEADHTGPATPARPSNGERRAAGGGDNNGAKIAPGNAPRQPQVYTRLNRLFASLRSRGELGLPPGSGPTR